MTKSKAYPSCMASDETRQARSCRWPTFQQPPPPERPASYSAAETGRSTVAGSAVGRHPAWQRTWRQQTGGDGARRRPATTHATSQLTQLRRWQLLSCRGSCKGRGRCRRPRPPPSERRGWRASWPGTTTTTLPMKTRRRGTSPDRRCDAGGAAGNSDCSRNWRETDVCSLVHSL